MRQIGRKNFKIADLPVHLGSSETVPAVLKDATYFPVKRGSFDKPTVNISYKHPLIAPIKAGDEIGTITITGASESPLSLPLYARDTVEKASLGQNILVSLRSLFGTYDIKPLESK